VIGSDISAGMIDTARSLGGEDGAPVSWRQASALDLPFVDGALDAVICQQGVQFFPDASAGLREMARVTKPSGRSAITVWASIEQSPFFEAEFQTLAEECGADPALWSQSFVAGGTSAPLAASGSAFSRRRQGYRRLYRLDVRPPKSGIAKPSPSETAASDSRTPSG
jgi:SAM-dependent methyltransferase